MTEATEHKKKKENKVFSLEETLSVHFPGYIHLLRLTAVGDLSRECEQQTPFALIDQMFLRIKELVHSTFCPAHWAPPAG